MVGHFWYYLIRNFFSWFNGVIGLKMLAVVGDRVKITLWLELVMGLHFASFGLLSLLIIQMAINLFGLTGLVMSGPVVLRYHLVRGVADSFFTLQRL